MFRSFLGHHAGKTTSAVPDCDFLNIFCILSESLLDCEWVCGEPASFAVYARPGQPNIPLSKRLHSVACEPPNRKRKSPGFWHGVSLFSDGESLSFRRRSAA
jgi:hypothetical protein